MSARSEKVRAAIFAKLNVPAVVGAGKATGVYHKKAPESAVLPYVIFHRVANRETLYALGNNLVGERDWWMIKALADEDSSTTKEPEELAEDILEAAEAAIGGSLAVSGNTVRRVARVMDIPEFIEEHEPDIYHHGFYLEVFTD